MRYGLKYDWTSSEEGHHPGTDYASVTMISNLCAELHSTAPYPVPQIAPASFLEVLHSHGHPDLWENLSLDGDRERMSNGIVNGSLVIAHDSSYMSLDSSDLCSARIIVFCTSTKQWLKASLVERSSCASNYHGKLLGALMSLLIYGRRPLHCLLQYRQSYCTATIKELSHTATLR
jgi:hypothetical protein